MRHQLHKLYQHQVLSREEAKETLIQISSGAVNASQIASFITVYLMRPIAVEELKGFKDALLELCLRVNFHEPVMDLCGTGGDERNTFNISTLSSFVVAASGVKVAKHGNYGVSSVSGSSNVLEYFGYTFTNKEEVLKKQLDTCNICFMHAPLFHPALKQVAPIRKEIGIKTFFNMLGPLVNPAFPQFRMTGVFNLELARTYNYLLQEESCTYCIVHSLDGYDEISNTSPFKIYTPKGEALVHPAQLGLKLCLPADLYGGSSVKAAAELFLNILEGKGSEAQQNAVIANAAYSIACYTGKTIEDCLAIARENLTNKNALNTFKKLIKQSEHEYIG